MAKTYVKHERMSPPCALVSVKEESSSECPAVVDETVADVSEVDDEASDTETGNMPEQNEQKPLSHQQAMEHFKDALAEIIVVCSNSGCGLMSIFAPPSGECDLSHACVLLACCGWESTFSQRCESGHELWICV